MPATTIAAEDVATVLGLVRRDLLFDIADAVAREDGAARVRAGRRRRSSPATTCGWWSASWPGSPATSSSSNVDPSRVADPELAAEAERERLKALAAKFSAEDLMRAFDVLTKAEYDIRGSAYPRYHLEMALLRWIHLRKLVPITDLIQGLEKGAPPTGRPQPAATAPVPGRSVAPSAAPARPPAPPPPSRAAAPAPAAEPPSNGRRRLRRARRRSPRPRSRPSRRGGDGEAPAAGSEPMPDVQPVAPEMLKDAFLSEVRKGKKFFYGTVVAQAQRIDIDGDRIVFTFAPQHRALRVQLDQTRALARRAGVTALGSQDDGRLRRRRRSAPTRPAPRRRHPQPEKNRQSELRQQALADSSVQAMLDVFAAEIKDVEEM